MDTVGNMNGSPSGGFNKTGRAGMVIDIGKGKEPGASRTISLGHKHRNRN